MSSMKADVRLRNITLVVMVSNLLYTLFPVSPMVLRFLLLLICVYVLTKRWNNLVPLEKWMFSLSAINFLYFLLTFLSKGASPTSVANNLCAFLPLSVFIYLTRRGVMTERFVSIMTIVLLLACVGYYINYERMRILQFGVEDSENLTINASTVFVMMMPLLFFEKKQILFYIE